MQCVGHDVFGNRSVVLDILRTKVEIENVLAVVEFGEHLIDFQQPYSGADPAVQALIEEGSRQRYEAHLSRRERDHIIKERSRMRARREQHTCYDIPPELRLHIKELAEKEGVPASQIAALALMRFASDWQNGKVDLSLYKTPSRSPKFDWNLALDVTDFGIGMKGS